MDSDGPSGGQNGIYICPRDPFAYGPARHSASATVFPATRPLSASFHLFHPSPLARYLYTHTRPLTLHHSVLPVGPMPSVRHPPSKSPAGSPARGVAPEVDSRRIASTRPPLPGNVNDKRARPHRDAPQPLNGTDASENRDVSSSHRQVAKELQGPTQSAKGKRDACLSHEADSNHPSSCSLASSRPMVTARPTTTAVDAPHVKTHTSGPAAGTKASSSSTRIAMSGQSMGKAAISTSTTTPGISHGSHSNHLVDSKRGDPAGGPSVRSTTAPIIPAGTPSKSHAPSPDLRRTPVADPSASSTSTPNGTSKSRPRAVPSAAEQTRHRVPVPATAPHRSAQAGEKEIAKILAGHMENCLTKLDQITEMVHKRKPFTGEDAVRSRAEKDRQKVYHLCLFAL